MMNQLKKVNVIQANLFKNADYKLKINNIEELLFCLFYS